MQGYNGSFSHQNENSLDFSMPIGTEILAIRDGVVVKVVEKNDINCSTIDCIKFNNVILVYHSDGTFAEYVHIKQNGSEVKVGEKVSQGQLIGYSGNVGYSSTPHLHVSVFKHTIKEKITLKTKFKINNGEIVDKLIERKEYSRNY
ncbi:M23 family metallopeptidase [Urechidicola vernalis]|uniref:M23 family metallopeptidase n=1 Tax=Urechidicola vernalis TaxID=3075600 RepID=A0ABU2Y6D7_9FLAO|nr:M23 family metallopeptidase [Urechidicola sp. P050]MDT0553759.1 M23 family metallopeptidase [Urechidicola sp. P050]